jgi:hypothetical protein
MFTERRLVEIGRALRNRGVTAAVSHEARLLARAAFRDASAKVAVRIHDAGIATFAAVESLATDDAIEAADVIGVCLTAERFDALASVVACIVIDASLTDDELSFASDIASEVRATRDACERMAAMRLGEFRALVAGHEAPDTVALADWHTAPCEWWIDVFRVSSRT